MADDPTPQPAPAPAFPPAPAPAPPPRDDDPDDDPADQGLTPQARALRRAREQRRTERDRANAAEARATAAETRATAAEARSGSVERLRQSLLEQAVAASAATLVAPEAHNDVLKLLDLSDLKVGDDGVIDQAKVKAKVEALVKDKPYLAAKPSNGPRPLPGGSQPPPTSGGFNEALREAVRR